MDLFQSRKQKHAQNADDHVSATPNNARSTFFSQRNKTLFLAGLIGLCLTLVTVGAVQALTPDAPWNDSEESSSAANNSQSSDNASQQTEAPVLNDTPSAPQADVFVNAPPAENSGEQRSSVTINGRQVPLSSDGSLQREVEGDVRVNVEQHSSGSGSSRSSSSVEIEVESSQ